MIFDKFFIDEEDFDFYKSLSSSEKLLFLHDLICEESYGSGSTITEQPERLSVQEMIKRLEDSISMIIETSVQKNSVASLVILNNFAIINSNAKKQIVKVASDLVHNGYILTKFKITKQQSKVYKKNKFCTVYKILGKTQEISLN